jgi:hypothetical protein
LSSPIVADNDGNAPPGREIPASPIFITNQ